MQPLKSVFGVIGALVPIVYCGGLLYYFLDNSGSYENAQEIGLGPTVLGLGVVGLLFFIPLLIKLARIVAGSGAAALPTRRASDSSKHDGESEFDADAAIARYMAQRPAEPASTSMASPSATAGGDSARPTFGRKVR